MAKKTYEIKDFSGGLNQTTNKRKIQDLALLVRVILMNLPQGFILTILFLPQIKKFLKKPEQNAKLY